MNLKIYFFFGSRLGHLVNMGFFDEQCYQAFSIYILPNVFLICDKSYQNKSVQL